MTCQQHRMELTSSPPFRQHSLLPKKGKTAESGELKRAATQEVCTLAWAAERLRSAIARIKSRIRSIPLSFDPSVEKVSAEKCNPHQSTPPFSGQKICFPRRGVTPRGGWSYSNTFTGDKQRRTFDPWAVFECLYIYIYYTYTCI